jgi:hypothetical protein
MQEALTDPFGLVTRPGGQPCPPQKLPVMDGRSPVVEAHPDFLALSWQGDLAYWGGIEVEREIVRLRKLFENRKVLPGRLRHRCVEAVIERYAHKQNGPYAIERMVFYKASEMVPKSLETHAAECIASFHDAPLHRYLVLGRCQPAADCHAELIFTRWRVQDRKYSQVCEVVTALHAEINAVPVPMKAGEASGPGPWWVWLVVIAAALAGALAASGGLLVWLHRDMLAGLVARLW